MWISLADVADNFLVFAWSDPEKKKQRDPSGISAFIVERGFKGFSSGTLKEKWGILAGNTGYFKMDDMEVPEENVLGRPGEGFKIAMATLDVFRTTVGAAALGFARRALCETVKRVTTRRLSGAPMSELQMVQGHVADMAMEIDAAALLVYRAAWAKDQGAARVSREAAMAKLYATEAAQRVIDTAVQLHGGEGVRCGHPVEALYREIRALRIYEGASDVQKIIIARAVIAESSP
jgi:acyl-CoA dehydrogenase